jgi:hypothetical protein
VSILGTALLPVSILDKYQVEERHHACAIAALDHFTLPRSQILTPGGRKSPISEGINGFFARRGWREKSFDIRVVVDGEVTLSPTHHVDYYKNRIAIETEWNNKDPFYDRDLTTFRLLFELNVVSVGVIITRADDLQLIFNALGRGKSFGASTTHLSKLTPKLYNRASGGCPVLAFGITERLYDPSA